MQELAYRLDSWISLRSSRARPTPMPALTCARHARVPLQRREEKLRPSDREAAPLTAARVHAFGEALARQVLRLHRVGDLPCQHFLDRDRLELLELSLHAGENRRVSIISRRAVSASMTSCVSSTLPSGARFAAAPARQRRYTSSGDFCAFLERSHEAPRILPSLNAEQHATRSEFPARSSCAPPTGRRPLPGKAA